MRRETETMTKIEKLGRIALASQIVLIALTLQNAAALAIEQAGAKSSQDLQHNNSNSKSPPVQSKSAHQLQQEQRRRPVWNLAHMVNSIKELDYRLSKGANAIEVDVTFGREGDPLYTYHGPPCDCWRHCHQQEDFNTYLAYVGEITAPSSPAGAGKNISLLFLDLKLDYLDQRAKARAGVELAKSITSHLFVDPDTLRPSAANGLRLILSVNHVGDAELVHNFLHQMEVSNSSWLMERIGFDVGMNDELDQIETMWRRLGGQQLNLWQGDGYTNCLSPFYNLERLSRAIQKRDAELGYPRKVYHWTIDLHDRMRESLRMGVDAIMTNHPERLLEVLREPELAQSYRLAGPDDDPFKKITGSRALARESARYQRSASSSASGGLLANLMDVLSSWLTYIKEIPFLSLPTTARFLPRARRQKQAVEFRAAGENSTFAPPANSTPPISEPPAERAPYEGPKWYTSLASGLLVSALKIFLPAQS